MKKTIARVAAAMALLLSAVTAQAGPFQFGPVVGANVNTFSLDSKTFSTDNRAGFTAGVMAKFTVPVINVGVDLSAMYVNRSTKAAVTGLNNETSTHTLNYNYLTVPLHIRYDLSLPAVSSIIVPYVFTGPNFAFRMGKSTIHDFKAKKYNTGWDFGLGIVLVKHLQINAGYTLNMNHALIHKATGSESTDIKGKTDGWTITAGWLF